jgi:hypothetical protein
MAVNTNPIYSGTGQIGLTTVLTSANISYDATAANAATVFLASSSGSFIQRVRFKASGSATATVARIFLNTAGGVTSSAVNNVLFDEITLAATTATQTTATAVYEVPMNIALPSGSAVVVAIGTAQVGGGGWYASAIGGSYIPQ